MRLHLAVAMLALATAPALGGEPGTGQFNPLARIGVAEVGAAGAGCLTIGSGALSGSDAMHLVAPQKPQTVVTARIVTKLPQSCSRNVAVPPDASFYSFRIDKPPAEQHGPAIAITGFTGDFTVERGAVRADLNGDGSLESFRSCASREGLHLTVWSGEPLRGKRLWHEYFYLGYDVEPDCTERDSGP